MIPIVKRNMNNFNGRKVLILGGMGFIGSNLAIRLVSLGAEVTLVDSMLPHYGGNLANIEPIEGRCHVNFSDIRDRHSLDYLVKGVEVIYNMAGQTSHVESMNDPMTDLEINCRSQLALLESCRAHNPDVRLIFASTRQLYGRPRYLPVDEKHPTEPVDVNGVHKLSAEGADEGIRERSKGLRRVVENAGREKARAVDAYRDPFSSGSLRGGIDGASRRDGLGAVVKVAEGRAEGTHHFFAQRLVRAVVHSDDLPTLCVEATLVGRA